MDRLADNIIVCMLFFNKLEQTIESAESFLRAGLAVNLLDNGSTAQAAAALRQHFQENSLVTIAAADSNRGVSGGRNLQIGATSQPWLVFVDNDISLDGDNLVSELAFALEAKPNAEVFVPRLFNKHEDAWVPFTSFVVDENGNCAFVESESIFNNAFPGGASIVSRSLFDRLGLYDEKLFVGFEDFELAIRAWKKGRPVLVASLDRVTFIHDHRVSSAREDKVSARVRYDVKSITHSHSVVERKHGVRLDPNFAEWLAEQTRQLTGDEVRRDPRNDSTQANSHVLRGKLTMPRWCGTGQFAVFIDGNDENVWLRLRALQLAVSSAVNSSIDVTRFLISGDTALARHAVGKGLVDKVMSIGEMIQTDLTTLLPTPFWVCWYSTGLITPDFLVKAAQSLIHDRSIGSSIIHPEHIVFANDNGGGVQYVKTGWFDPLEADHDIRLYPMFVAGSAASNLGLQEPRKHKEVSFIDLALALVARSAGRGERHFALPGSVAVVGV
jgi:GT2 family glycosyltransferase